MQVQAPLGPRVPQFHGGGLPDPEALRDDLRAGLAAPQAVIAPKFFYDRLGSTLFEAITRLDEYYPTRTEAAIFRAHATAMAQALGTGGTMVDLGAGNCQKAAALFPALQPARYVAVDIAVDFVQDALIELQRLWPTIEMHGVGADFTRDPRLPAGLLQGPVSFFYPGSSIGNFTPDEAVRFLARLRQACPGAQLLIGADLVKDSAVLQDAYDDALGVTAAFNLNVLRHVNRVLGSDFDPRGWRHVARYDTDLGRIEMHLQAVVAQAVRWPGGARVFAPGERIHTENSYKYEPAAFEALLRDAGFAESRRWTDAAAAFGVWVAR